MAKQKLSSITELEEKTRIFQLSDRAKSRLKRNKVQSKYFRKYCIPYYPVHRNMSECNSQLDSLDESMYIVCMYLTAIGLTIAVVILFSLHAQKNAIKNRKSFQFAVASVVCSVIAYLLMLTLDNDLLFAWKYSGKHLSFVSLIDSINNTFYIFGKISFYCSFTYFVLSVFDANNKTKKYLKIWMIIACFLLFCLMIGYMIDDASEVALKEIGVTSKHNIHLTMILGHDGTNYAHYLAFIAVIIDMIYFVVLSYCYIKQIKSIKSEENNRNAIKGVVLIFMACLTFWIFMISIVTESSLQWFLLPIDVILECLYFFDYKYVCFHPLAYLYFCVYLSVCIFLCDILIFFLG